MSVEAFGLEISFKGSRRGLRCELMPASFLGVSKRKIQDVSGSMQRKEGASARGCRGRGENMEKGLGRQKGRAVWAHGGSEDKATTSVSHLP